MSTGATLAELFRAAKGAPIKWRGEVVRMMYELSGLGRGEAVLLTFTKASSARRQGLRVKGRGGFLEVNGQSLEDVVLWTDSASNPVRLSVRPKNATMSVRVWNAWRDPRGTMHSWIGNSGIIVEEDQNGVVLKCSDGFNDPTFDDLIVELRVVAENEPLIAPPQGAVT